MVNTKPNLFKQLVKEISILEGYEALRDLDTYNIEVETPIEKTDQTISQKYDFSACFAPSKIKTIMQSNSEVGKMSRDVPSYLCMLIS